VFAGRCDVGGGIGVFERHGGVGAEGGGGEGRRGGLSGELDGER